MFAFSYTFDCPLCGQTYNPGLEVILAHSKEDAIEKILHQHRTCPFCTQCLIGKEVRVKVF